MVRGAQDEEWLQDDNKTRAAQARLLEMQRSSRTDIDVLVRDIVCADR